MVFGSHTNIKMAADCSMNLLAGNQGKGSMCLENRGDAGMYLYSASKTFLTAKTDININAQGLDKESPGNVYITGVTCAM